LRRVLLERLVPEREPLARAPLRDDEPPDEREPLDLLREDADLLRDEPEPDLRAELEREPLDELRDDAGFREELDLRADDPLDRELDDDLRAPLDALRVPVRDRLDDELDRFVPDREPLERELLRDDELPERDRLDEELDRELLDRRRPDELRRSAAGISSCATAFVSCGISLAR
jgi:hypothetical protein